VNDQGCNGKQEFTTNKKTASANRSGFLQNSRPAYMVGEIATATATEAPNIGLLPIPINPII
jgi:hypothetical protein